MAKATASETKAIKGLVKASNSFNKITDGGRNLGGLKGMIASKKLDVTKSTVDFSRKLKVASGMAKKVSGGILGKIVNEATQNATIDKLKSEK